VSGKQAQVAPTGCDELELRVGVIFWQVDYYVTSKITRGKKVVYRSGFRFATAQHYKLAS
jgi:hypothetical protein